MPFQAEQAQQEEETAGHSPPSAVGTNFQSAVAASAAAADSQLTPYDSVTNVGRRTEPKQGSSPPEWL